MALSAVSSKSTVRPAAARRSAVVVKASAESRRAVLGGLLAGAALTTSNAALALGGSTPVDIIDDRKALATGFDLIYEARDLDLPQNERDGMTQARTNIEDTKKRVKEAKARIDTGLDTYVKKNYWTEAREQLRRQVGTLRFDLNALASSQPKDKRAVSQSLKKDFIAKVESFDLALRQKNERVAAEKLVAVKASLDAVAASVL